MDRRATDDVLRKAHELLALAIKLGDVVVDATVGNGHDTLHLAKCVGPEGLVIGFDVQGVAISKTRGRLEEVRCSMQTILIRAGHETIAETVPKTLTDRGRDPNDTLAAVCFNLGYLPGGDKTIITRSGTTLIALHAALTLLRPSGILTAVLYPGHPGGEEERDAVLAWASELPEEQFEVVHYLNPGRKDGAELLSFRVL